MKMKNKIFHEISSFVERPKEFCINLKHRENLKREIEISVFSVMSFNTLFEKENGNGHKGPNFCIVKQENIMTHFSSKDYNTIQF